MHDPLSRAIDLARQAPDLGKTCDDYLVSYKKDILAAIRRGEGGVAVARKHARVLDGLLGALYCAADATSRTLGHHRGGRFALLAVGGWGRGLLGLGSDIDTVLLCEDPTTDEASALAEAMLYPLWDLGLSVGHAVRGIDDTIELSRKDPSTATALLDMRLVAGDKSLFDALRTAARRQLFDVDLDAFLDALLRDREDRHEKFGATLFLLEPEVKLGRGGLRDLDMLRWALVARTGSRLPDDWTGLGFLLPRELKDLEHAEEFLWRVRHLLHARMMRRQDRLTFEDQEDIATELGFVDGVTLGVEQFMQAYYRHARVIAQTSDRVLSRVRPAKQRSRPATTNPIGDGLAVFEGELTFERAGDLALDPSLALRIYDAALRLDARVYSFARDAIVKLASDPEWCERLRDQPAANASFLRLLTHAAPAPFSRGSVLTELHEVGLLLAVIPEFEPVMGRVQHDVYHVYTVDVHSMAAVDRLRAVVRGELASEMPLASQLAADGGGSVELFLGVLLHDIGKAHGKEHAQRGARMAESIVPRLGLSPESTREIAWLVEEHLSLYHWAMRRDISDPETLLEVASRASSVERLRDLYLLTLVDLSTTNPKALSSWKARMLDELYLATLGVLEASGTAPEASSHRAESIASAFGDNERPVVLSLLESLPSRYLAGNDDASARFHARAVLDRDRAPVRVVCRMLEGGLVEVVVCVDDRPGLLADLAAVLTANRLAVQSAQIYTHPRAGGAPAALDIFHVRPAPHIGGDERSWAARVERDIAEILSGNTPAARLLASRARPPAWSVRRGPEVPTDIRIDNTTSRAFTIVDIFTRDRVGLLHAIARTLHDEGLVIGLSKVNTEGLRVADVFYVTGAGGEKLIDPARIARLDAGLREAIAGLDGVSREATEGEES
jgi:[protein-PII] uridylyltransferase